MRIIQITDCRHCPYVWRPTTQRMSRYGIINYAMSEIYCISKTDEMGNSKRINGEKPIPGWCPLDKKIIKQKLLTQLEIDGIGV
jgi:hypothetical protein